MKLFNKILLIIFALFLNIDVVYSLNVDSNTLTLKSGENESVELYANVNEEVVSVKFSLVFSSYDVTATFNPVVEYNHSVPRTNNHLINFSTAQSGNIKLGDVIINVADVSNVTTGNINIHNATATTLDGRIIKLNSQNIKVNVSQSSDKEKTQVNTSYNLLSRIDSDLVKIDILDNVYNYDIEVPKEITELDLRPIPKEEGYKVDISSQKIGELEDNSIKISVSTKAGIEQEYVVNVKAVEMVNSNAIHFDIDDSKFEGNISYKMKWIGVILILELVLVMGIFISKKKIK